MVSYKALNTWPESIIKYNCYRIRDCDWLQAAAVTESIIANTCYRIRDYDWCQAAAMTESTNTNTCYRIRDCDWCQADAIFESWISYTCYTILRIVYLYGWWYSNVSFIFISPICYFCNIAIWNQIIIYSIHLNIVGGCSDWEENAEDERCH